jgi:hypothetical protein
MTVIAPARRPPIAARRAGYVVAVALMAAFWFLLNVNPGWQIVPFLTDDAGRVITLANLSLGVSIVANLAYLVYDPPWWRSLGEVLTTAVGLAVLVRLWQVFPFTFTGSIDWSMVARVTLIVAIAGSIVGIIVNLVIFLRSVPHRKASPARR